MTWLFVRFYLCVLVVLTLAWYIHGAVLKQRADSEWARVIVTAHGGGARLVARELNAASAANRAQVLDRLRLQFDYPLMMVPLNDLPSHVQRQLSDRDDVAYLRQGDNHCYVAALSTPSEVALLGPFPDYELREIEESIGGWMRLAAAKLDAVTPADRPAVLQELRTQFDFPIDIEKRQELPEWPRGRIERGEDIVFYSSDPQLRDQWFAATPLSDDGSVARFGPFPNFERVEQTAATTTLALVLLPAAFAIALLLRPVARQLRHVERAAQEFAAGDLTARVDERRFRAAKPLAQAFNNMACRIATLVRTQRELLQTVSHELRTPLSRMKFGIELIGTATDEQQRERRLQELDRTTDELDELVGELISYVRLETTDSQLDMEPISLPEAIGSLISQSGGLYPSIAFELGHFSDEQRIIRAERTGFQRAIGNLLSNAGRYATSRVNISASTDGQFVRLDVDDDGPGIPKSERERVFDAFQRLDDDRNGRGGVGLGLTLVKRIVTRHGGSVEALTSPLGGCRMRTRWPKGKAGIEHDER